MAKRVSSRLVKKERQKIIRQTAIFIGIAILILAGFLFLILPSFIRILNAILGTNLSTDQQDTIPPQPPVLSAPPAATGEQELTLSGFAESESEVIFTLNGEELEPVVAREGRFSQNLLLEEGENRLSAYAVDAADNKSAQSKSYTIVLDTLNPLLELESPEEGQEFVSRQNQEISVKGTTDPDSRVYVNDRAVFPDEEGSFEYRLRLSEGENEIRLRAVDAAGNTSESTVIVKYTP